MSTRQIADSIIDAIKRGNKILVCGNGGSASQANHFAAELINKFEREREALPIISLSSDIATITSIGNDSDFKYIFSRQIEAIGSAQDLLVTLSTSGTSPNILEAQKAAKKRDLEIIAFPTNKQLKLKTPDTQEHHLHLIHKISGLVEDHFA